MVLSAGTTTLEATGELWTISSSRRLQAYINGSNWRYATSRIRWPKLQMEIGPQARVAPPSDPKGSKSRVYCASTTMDSSAVPPALECATISVWDSGRCSTQPPQGGLASHATRNTLVSGFESLDNHWISTQHIGVTLALPFVMSTAVHRLWHVACRAVVLRELESRRKRTQNQVKGPYEKQKERQKILILDWSRINYAKIKWNKCKASRIRMPNYYPIYIAEIKTPVPKHTTCSPVEPRNFWMTQFRLRVSKECLRFRVYSDYCKPCEDYQLKELQY